jgi:hypothetical protein
VKLEGIAGKAWNDQVAVWCEITGQFQAWKRNATGKAVGIRSFVKAVNDKWETGTNYSVVQRAVTVCEAPDEVTQAYVDSLKSMTDASLRGANDFVVAFGKVPPAKARFSADREGKALAVKAVKQYGSQDKAIKVLEAALAAAKAGK